MSCTHWDLLVPSSGMNAHMDSSCCWGSLMGRVSQAEAIASTLGQQQRALAEKPASEVVIAEERHPLSLHDQQEELRIVLTRPLVEPRALEVLQVGPDHLGTPMHTPASSVDPI